MHQPKANSLLFPTSWLVLSLSLLSSHNRCLFSMGGQRRANKTPWTRSFSPPSQHINHPEQRGGLLHLNTRPQITCSVAAAPPQTLAVGSYLRRSGAFRGGPFTCPRLDPAGPQLLSTCLFSQGPPKLRAAPLRQGFLAEMLIWLPSRLQQAPLLFGLLCVYVGGKRRPGDYLQARIYPSLPRDTVSKQHIIQPFPALFLKPAMLMRLFCALTSLFPLAINTPAGALFHSWFFFLRFSPVWASKHRFTNTLMTPVLVKPPT